MSFFTEGRSLTKGRVRVHQPTDEDKRVQNALISEQYQPCQRIALTTCRDPRVDIECVVEDGYAWMCANWPNRPADPVGWLHSLVRSYARKARKQVPDSWTRKDWYGWRVYAEYFADVADEEVAKGLRVVDEMPESMKRIFEARCVFGYRREVTAELFRVSVDSVGTSDAIARIRAVTDAEAVLAFFAEQMEGGS
ncbi:MULTISPECIES: sigma-70 family RNA polymerase sigma factor [Streptomyces]|uniref:Uncharacterized protein n=1 Tax=Streptomyces katrae TaxID=68223 RepID=A0A0F4JQJ1_9ACTN|nr:sigma-70 family RNA polymerase sigma factor [Streptomyces katrae]KJY36445.1 hypothetical protein VR44_08010 [Streptomyces katrae]